MLANRVSYVPEPGVAKKVFGSVKNGNSLKLYPRFWDSVIMLRWPYGSL